MNTNIFAQRRERLRERMYALGLDAVLVSHAANRFYLSGFELHDTQCNESSGRLLITADGHDWLYTDSRYTDAARRLWDANYIFIYGADSATQLRKHIAQHAGGRVGMDGGMCLQFYQKLSSGVHLVPAYGLVEDLRIIKDADEITRIKRSCDLNHRLMEWVWQHLAIGMTERQISWDIEVFFRENGASELAFSNIVAIGSNAALPHYEPGDVPITENTPILIDVGCRLDRYCSDQTRTFWIGDNPTVEYTLTNQLVRSAQEAAIAAIAPGKTASEIYHVARNVFVEEGVADAFTHSLGHGVGLETHEAPSLNSRCHTVLQPGMVVTVEPGLYYPQWGGVRREFMVLVTEDGAQIL